MKRTLRSAACLFLLLAVCSCGRDKPQQMFYHTRMHPGYTGEAPMLPFHGEFRGQFSGQPNPFSPDPLFNARWDMISETDKLELYELYPVEYMTDAPESFENLESSLKDKVDVRVTGAGNIMFDFGVESAAWLEFDSPDLSGEVELSISEYTEPARLNAGAINMVKTLKPVQYGNTYRLELNHELHEGVRFGWLHVRKFDKPFTITKIRKVAQTKPVNYDGAFECDDAMLNRIWYTGAYSVRVNMLFDYISPILMERSDRFSWAGDAHLIQATALVAFGNYPHVRQNLNHNQDKSIGIESYDLIWVKSVVDYFFHTGETDLFKSHIGYMQQKLDRGSEIFDNPDMGATAQGNYIGWDERLGAGFEHHQNEMNLRNLQFLWLETTRLAAKAFSAAGETELADKYESLAARKFAALASDPAFLDGLDIHAAAAAINTGLLTPEQEQRLFAERYTDRLHRVSFSPFNGYFIMESLSRMGRFREAIETIDDCWGSQVRYGGTTFFEVFHPSWADVLATNAPIPNTQCGYTSLCHPWSSGVTRWLTDEVLGITPIAPGYREALIKPNPVNLKRVRGSVPTPSGIISARYDFEKGTATVTIPEGVVAKVGFPKRGLEIASVTSGGSTLWSPEGVSDRTHVYIENVGAGTHTYNITYEGTFRPEAFAPPIRYAITGGEPEALSWDEGYARYGSDGLVLFTPQGREEVLPPYIRSVGVALNNVNMPWKPKTVPTGKTATFRDASGNFVSVELGMVITNNPYACNQCFTIDIPQNGRSDYKLTLYVTDKEGASFKRQGFELFDLNTLELLSPLSVVEDFQGGKFVTFEVDRDVRIRVYHIWGDQAVISALLFSK